MCSHTMGKVEGLGEYRLAEISNSSCNISVSLHWKMLTSSLPAGKSYNFYCVL